MEHIGNITLERLAACSSVGLQIRCKCSQKGDRSDATAHPRTCIFPANAGERMSFSHPMPCGSSGGVSPPSSLTALRDRIRKIEAPARHGVLPFDVPAIDRALPGGGLALGAVHEILGADGDEEDGAAACGFIAGLLARLRRGPVLWCLKRPDLYGPGLLAHGLDPARLVIVTAPRDEDILWAIEEGLRAPGLVAVIGEIGRLPLVAGRRLQLAAERSGITAFLLRRWRNSEEAARERGG